MKAATPAFPHVAGASDESFVNLVAAANSSFPGFITRVVDGGGRHRGHP